MRKRAISAVLAASMMLSVVPAPAFAAGNRAGGGTLPDEVTAQTLEQENATEVSGNHSYDTINGDVTVTGGHFQGTTFTGDVEIDGGYFLLCKFEGKVTIYNDSEDIQNCKFQDDVEIRKIKDSAQTAGNTFYGYVKVSRLGTKFRNDSFLGGVEGMSLGFTSCTLSGEIDDYTRSTFNNCVIVGSLPTSENFSAWSKITVGDGLASDALKFASSNMDVTPAAGTEAWYQEKAYVFGDISQITNIDDKKFSDGLTVDEKYRVDVMSSNYFQLKNLNKSVNTITLTHQEAPLAFDANGYPEGSDGGTKNVTASTWKYTQGNKTLTLTSGDFTLNSSNVAVNQIFVADGATLKDSELSGKFYLTVNKGGAIEGGAYDCVFVANSGTIEGGSFKTSGEIKNNGEGIINSGTFNAENAFTNLGTINGGTFNFGGSAYGNGTVKAGIFLKQLNNSGDLVPITLDSEDYEVNGLPVSDSKTVYIKADGKTEQTLELEYTGDAAKTYGWNVTVNGTSYGTLSAGESKDVFGTAQAAVSEDGTKLTITASSIPGQLSGQSIGLSAVHVPTYRAEDVTVKLGNQKISNKATLTYSPDLTEITVTDKSGESISGYTTKITDTKDNEVENFDGKPGKYKLIVSFNANDDHAASEITYTFGVKAADMNAELFEKYYTVELPGKNGEVAYDGEAHGVTVTKNADAPAALSDRIATIQYSNGISFPSYDAPTEPGTYSIYVSVYDNDYYNYYYPSNSAATFTITKGQLPDDEKNNLYFVEDNADQLASLDPTFDVSSFTGTDTYFYLDANGNKYTDLSSAPAGEYTKYRTFTSTKYDDVDVAFAKPEYSTTPDVENFAEADLRGITTANAAEKLAELNVALTEDSYISSDDVTITYYQVDEDGTETEVTGIPTEVGNYVFKVSVKESTGTIDGTDTPKYNAADLTSDKWAFTIEQGAEPDPDPVNPDGDGGAAVAAVIGTAAVGGAAYLVGTQVWLETNLPKGAAIPTNRQQLADLLWTTAGKPEPKSNVLYTDIAATAADSQKAARWCVEQGLLKDNGETFQPKAYTFRPQVIKAWTDLQAQLKADNK